MHDWMIDFHTLGPWIVLGAAAFVVLCVCATVWIERWEKKQPVTRVVNHSDIRIGHWADYINYDPGGIAGPPTPRDPAFEDAIFGREMMKTVRKGPQRVVPYPPEPWIDPPFSESELEMLRRRPRTQG